jgi:hypothetical protein
VNNSAPPSYTKCGKGSVGSVGHWLWVPLQPKNTATPPPTGRASGSPGVPHGDMPGTAGGRVDGAPPALSW